MLREFVPGWSFDSRLYTTRAWLHRNADLYLITRVYMKRVDPAGTTALLSDSYNTNATIDRWTDGEWNSFRATFKRQIESRFNDHLWIVPSTDWGYVSHANEPCRPNVKCMVQVELQNSQTNAHLVVNCYHIPPGTFLRSSMGPRTGTLDNADILPPIAPNLCGLSQETLPHEFGHHLGLDHVGNAHPACVTGAELQCYCPTPRAGTDMLGGGNRLDRWHTWPWRRRIWSHLGSRIAGLRWDSTLQRPIPLRLSPSRSRTVMPGGVPALDGGV